MNKHIKLEKMEFMDFFKKICDFLDGDGVLRNIIIEDCVITNIPRNYKVMERGETRTFLGIKIHEGSGRFCGFIMENSFILRNHFYGEDYCFNCNQNVGKDEKGEFIGKCANCGC